MVVWGIPLIREKNKTLRDYLTTLQDEYERISLSEIADQQGLKWTLLPRIRKTIRDLISAGIIQGKLIEGELFLGGDIELEPPIPSINEQLEPTSQLRLIGMIRLEREIKLVDAAKFLNISVKELKAFLYDLAGQGNVQGKFVGDKFIIESDVDNFLEELDPQFEQWDYGSKI